MRIGLRSMTSQNVVEYKIVFLSANIVCGVHSGGGGFAEPDADGLFQARR
jgi:hypothetical protein